MSPDEITPARLRELADVAFDTEFRDLQAALRAAASVIEEERKRSDTAGDLVAGMNEENLRLTATLAAREALLREANTRLRELTTPGLFGDDGRAAHIKALALAAEIAAALGGTDD